MTLSRDLLVVTPTPSHPLDAGNRKRIYSFFKYLQANSYKIHYVQYNNDDLTCNKSNYEAMREEWDYFDVVVRSSTADSHLAKLRKRIIKSSHYYKLAAKGLHVPIQYKIDDWYCDTISNFVKWKFRNFPISVIFVEYVFLSKVLECVPKSTLKIIDTHDIFANRHISLIKSKIRPQFFTTSPKEEVKGLNRADLVLAIQEEEQEYFEERITPDVMQISHIEEAKFISKKYQKLSSVGILASSNSINVRSLRMFLDLVSKKKSLDSLKIFIAGNVCKEITYSSPNVILLGQVDCLKDFYSIADIYINPMIAGTGLKIKTIEAFSYGVPFLSTQIGSTGTGSNLEFHNFSELEELIDELDQIYSNQTSLEVYQEASKSCFRTYRSQLDAQLNSLLERLERKGNCYGVSRFE